MREIRVGNVLEQGLEPIVESAVSSLVIKLWVARSSARWAASMAATKISPSKIEMMMITTSNSTRVKPTRRAYSQLDRFAIHFPEPPFPPDGLEVVVAVVVLAGFSQVETARVSQVTRTDRSACYFLFATFASGLLQAACFEIGQIISLSLSDRRVGSYIEVCVVRIRRRACGRGEPVIQR